MCTKCTLMVAGLILILGIVVMIIFVPAYIYNKDLDARSTQTECTILSYEFESVVCIEPTYGNKRIFDLCYKASVIVGMLNDKNATVALLYQTGEEEALRYLGKNYPLNARVDCWYDTTNPSSVRLEQANITGLLAFVIIGVIMVVAAIVTIIIYHRIGSADPNRV